MNSHIEFIYDEDKSARLRRTRGIGFEEIIEYIEAGSVLGFRLHTNQTNRPGQWLCDVDVDGYVYSIPFYARGQQWELKTLYPSRAANKRYFGDER